MTYLNNEKHETFLTHAIIQGGDFYCADHTVAAAAADHRLTTGWLQLELSLPPMEEAKVFLGMNQG